MTPEREKAEELLKKFDLPSEKPFFMMSKNHSKQCALIAVDEIIASCEYNYVESHNTAWWLRVKQEIEKL